MANQTVQLIYDAQYATLLEQRQRYVFYLESINNQIAELKRQARKDQVVITEQATK